MPSRLSVLCVIFVAVICSLGNVIADDMVAINEDYDKLKADFNASRGKVRLLLIVSPG